MFWYIYSRKCTKYLHGTWFLCNILMIFSIKEKFWPTPMIFFATLLLLHLYPCYLWLVFNWPFNWDCATIGHWSPANCKNRFQIISPHSAGSVCRFSAVNHQILLSTLSSLDITGIPLRWFESYLTGRSFKVAWGGEVSKANKLVTGVPQGSVLGLLLFSTYTTSLGPIIQAHGFS